MDCYLLLTTCISLIYSFYITYKLAKITYPDQINNLKFKIGWYLALFYTLCNKFYNKTKVILGFSLAKLNNEKKYSITFIENGLDVHNIKTNTINFIKDVLIDYDIILYEFSLEHHDGNMKKCCIFTTNPIISEDYFKNIKQSNIKFLAPQLHIKNINFPIVFKDTQDIYFQNNILFWNNFAKWYLFSMYDIVNDNNTDDVLKEKIKIIDQIDYLDYYISFINNNMDTITVKSTEHIILNESSYEICKNDVFEGKIDEIDENDENDENN